MTPLEFLAVVLPSPGHGAYCAVELTANKDHIFVDSLDEFYPTVSDWVAAKNNVYFGLSTYDEVVKTIKGNKNRRIARHTQYIKSLFIDMDGYASKKEAAKALSAFMVKTGLDLLGVPWVVNSGGGLHCYWPFEKEVEVSEWKPVAENLKRLCVQEALKIDMTVTADSARVLRIPETFNFKDKYPEPREVRILAEGDTFDFDDLAKHIESQLKMLPAVKAPTLELPGTRPTAEPTATALKLFENSVTKFRKIVERTREGTGCGQLKFYMDNAQDDGMEPIWRGLLSIAQKCEENEKAVIWLSEMHPYDRDRMHTKLREIKGPYPCTKFDSENPGICTGCQHWGKITNPLALGREYALETVQKEIDVGVEEMARKILRPEPPRGYAYGKNGGVFMEKQDEDAEGNKIVRQVPLLAFDLFPVDILNMNGEHMVHMSVVRHNNVETVTIPQKSIVSKDETAKHLANQNVLAAFGSGNDKNLYDYVRACVEKMSVEKSPIVVPPSYGWQEDDTFVFAGKIYSAKGAIAVPMPGLENIVANTNPTGTIEAWRAFIQLLIKKKLWKHVAIILAGAGAALMKYTGMYGMTYHCGSTDSGTGKSLALEGAASIWGHPVHYRTGESTSPVAMQQRLGLLNSCPLITDEITSKNRKDFEWFSSFTLSMTEGRGKERMESGSNKERLNLSRWATNAIMSSNTYSVDHFTGAQEHSAEGELRRLLEFVMGDVLKWEPHEIEIVKTLHSNYAVAGHLFVDHMVRDISKLKSMVPEVVQQMYKELRATNDERFWMAGIGANVAAGILFSNKHAGIVDIPMEPVMEAYSDSVNYMRTAIKSGVRTAEDVLNGYTSKYFGNLIIVKFLDKGSVLAELGDGGIIDASTTKSNVMGRIEHGVTPGYIDFYIEERLLKAYCSTMSFGYADFKRQLENMFSVTHMPKKDMMAKTKGPQMRVSVLRISRRIDEDLADTLSLGTT